MATPAAHTLAFYEPGHFHAAMTLKSPNLRVRPRVHLYAAPGADRDAFLALVASFNSREEKPTAWEVEVHGDGSAASQLEALVADGLATIVVLAGKNDRKMETIARLTSAGINVLADKPWCTHAASLPHLAAATAAGHAGTALAMDIMTNKHDVYAQLRRAIVLDPSLFGGWSSDESKPQIELGALHHLAKVVNGAPLRRPPWYYDVRVQGNGLVDVHSHLVDQVQWLVSPNGGTWAFDDDVRILSAKAWDTAVDLPLYRDSTGLEAFEPDIAPLVVDSVLPLRANGAIEYELRGVRVRQQADWFQREPPNSGDAHTAILRGELCDITMAQV